MIRRIRRLHRVAGIGALGLAPIGVLIALVSRPRPAPNPIVPGDATPAGLSRLGTLAVEAGFAPAPGDSFGLTVHATAPPGVADPLLYWAPAGPAGDSIPANARPLCSLSAERACRRTVPGAIAAGGYFLVVDGARRRVVAGGPVQR